MGFFSASGTFETGKGFCLTRSRKTKLSPISRTTGITRTEMGWLKRAHALETCSGRRYKWKSRVPVDSGGRRSYPRFMNGSNNQATSARYVVILFAVTLAVITYMQRHAISQAAPAIREDLGLSKLEMGLVFSAFGWMYALCEIPGGFAGDRWGARRVLAALVGAWSFLTAATGWVWNLSSLVVMRGSFGALQAGCFPNIARMFANWLPTGDRVRAQGIMWLSARWGGALRPLVG